MNLPKETSEKHLDLIFSSLLPLATPPINYTVYTSNYFIAPAQLLVLRVLPLYHTVSIPVISCYIQSPKELRNIKETSI